MSLSSRDTAVQSTNDDATMCKAAAVNLGYWKDDYVSVFTRGRAERKTPEINKGYYARVKVVSNCISNFVQKFSGNCQIISLGCGYDTLFWRLYEGGCKPLRYIEVDFVSVVQRKLEIIQRSPKLLNSLVTPDGEISSNGQSLHAEAYHLVSSDLRQTDELSAQLKSSGVSKSLPTLIVAECVLVYMKPNESSALLKLFSDMFSTSVFVSYEQVNMNDRFGQVMLENLEARGCSLAGAEACLSKKTQQDRFLDVGWSGVHVLTMDEVYRSLPKEELARIEKIEFFDERELLDQLLTHYCVAVAWKDPNQIGLEDIVRFRSMHP